MKGNEYQGNDAQQIHYVSGKNRTVRTNFIAAAPSAASK